jgi:DNA-binding Lrp family transcriptional regulator
MEKAFVCISTTPSALPNVIQKIEGVKETEEVEMVHGVYDVCFKVKGTNIDELKRTINDHIRKMDNVRDTLTTILVNSR